MSPTTAWKRAAPVVLLIGASGAAHAHPGHGAADLAAGLLHPLAGLDHLLAMVTVGLWSAVALPTGRRWQAPALFVALMALGAAIAAAGWPLPGALEAMVAASVVLLGGLLAGGARMAASAGLAVVAAAALLHGAAHGLEAAPGASLLLYGAGFVAATAALHVLGLAAGGLLADASARLRMALGAIVGAGGLLLLVGRV